MGENLVLYKDLSGTFGLVDRHCPHRRADMSYGWVEASGIRCSYHGWRYDETGACIDQPYEDTTNPKPSKSGCEIKAYPVREMRGPAVGLHGSAAGARAAGVGAVQLAERLSRDRAGRRAVQLVPGPGELDRSRALRMDARQLERAACAAATRPRRSISSSSSRSSSTASPTSACARARARRTRYWTVGRVALWPNGFYLGRHFEWRVPVDDENTLSVAWFFVRVPKGREPYVQNSVPTWKSPIQGEDGRWITSHVINQDIVAWVGQGTIADRTQEHLRSSDIGITMMRNRFFEEIEAIKAGRDPKGVIRDPSKAQAIDLPDMARELNTQGITLAEFQNDPLLRQRLKEFRHHYGQPPEVRAAFAEAMGIAV